MGKSNFFKNLIFESDSNDNEDKEEEVTPPAAFTSKIPPVPTEKVKVSTTSSSSVKQTFPVVACDPYMIEITKLYQDGFKSLNKPGYDFFEFFKGIQAMPQPVQASTYTMAMTMAKAMNPDISKDIMLAEAEAYKVEILKVYQNYDSKGQAKLSQLDTAKTQEKKQIVKNLSDVNREIQTLLNKKAELETQQRGIDQLHDTQIQEANCKIVANNAAKDELIDAITEVVTGITTNIK